MKIWVSQFVEICIDIRWAGVGRNSERDRISTKKRLKNASEPQAEIAPPPIANSIFFLGEREGPGFLAKLARMALVKGLR